MPIESPAKKQAKATQQKINPEIDAQLNAFIKSEPDLVKFVKDLSREELERKFLLRKMWDRDDHVKYDAKIRAWMEKPENADLVATLKAAINPRISPEKQEARLLESVKTTISRNGIKLG
jgi:hypothetical protein